MQGYSISGAKRLSPSGEGSGEGTSRAASPPSLVPYTQLPKISSIGKESTSVSRSTTSPSAAVGSNPQDFVDVPENYPPGPSVADPNEEACKGPSLGSGASISDLQANGLDPDAQQSFPGSTNKIPRLNKAVTGECEQPQILDCFLLAPRVLDDDRRPGAILLKYRLTSIPMPQNDIQKELLGDREHGQPMLDNWLELRDHERLFIDHMVYDLRTHVSVMRLKRMYTDITFRGILFKDIPQLHFIMDQQAKKDQDKDKEVATAGWERGTRHHRPTRSRDISMEDELPKIERELTTPAVQGGKYPILPPLHRHRDLSVSLSPPSPPESRRRRSQMHQHGRTSPSPDRDTELQRSREKPEGLKYLGELKKLEQLNKSEKSKKSEARRRSAQITINDCIDEPEQSGDRYDSSIVSDESIHDEEAERAVKELLGKYTTLGSVAGGIA